MLLVALVSVLLLAAAEQVEDDWIDPYDMLNYDASTKSMRKPAEQENYVPAKRGQHSQESCQVQQIPCDGQVENLQKEIEEQKKRIKIISQQPTCAPVFKRFLSRLLKEIQAVGLPKDSADVYYDAKIKLSRQSITEIQTLLEGEESWRTGALDNAISQILVNLRPHDHEAWKWRFEDTFGVEVDTLLKVLLCFMMMGVIIGTQLWSIVSWAMQFRRLFAMSFFVSIIWNWFYLYKKAFADHKKTMINLDDIGQKCTGMQRFDWSDNLKEWLRGTFTLQDDPCKKYYEALFVDPLWLVPPSKAFSVTIVTLITEPLKHIGEGISEFIRALLKDLPITLQIPVSIAVLLCILVVIYGIVQASFQHGIMAPFCSPQRDPPPPPLQQPQHRHGLEDFHFAGGDGPQYAISHQADERSQRNRVYQRRANRPRENPAKVVVETLRTSEQRFSRDEMDAQLHEEEQSLSLESDSENQLETQEELEGESAINVAAKSQESETKPTKSDSTLKRALKVSEQISKDMAVLKSPASRKETALSKEEMKAIAEDRNPSKSQIDVETVGVPLQESSPVEQTASTSFKAKLTSRLFHDLEA